MKTASHFISRKTVFVLATFAFSATNVISVQASAVDPTTTTTVPVGAEKPTLPKGNLVETKPGADLMVAVTRTGPVVAGRAYMGVVSIENVGNESAGSQSAVSFTLKSLPTFVSVTSVGPAIDVDAAVGSRGWDCKALQCVWVEKTTEGMKNASLSAGASIQADVQLDIAADAKILASSEGYFEAIAAAKNDVRAVNKVLKTAVHLSVVANNQNDLDTTNNEAVMDLLADAPGADVVKSVNGAGTAGAYIDAKLMEPFFPGGPFHMELRYLPTGSETQSGKITFTNIVSKKLGLKNVVITGAGWSCSDIVNLESCAHTGNEVKPGNYSDALVIDGIIGSGIAVGGRALRWDIAGASVTTFDNTPVDAFRSMSLKFQPAPIPDLVVDLVPRDGKSSVSPPEALTIDALVKSVGATAENVHVVFSFREGLTFKGIETNDLGWKCQSTTANKGAGKGATAQDCIIGKMNADVEQKVSLVIGTSETTKPGSAQVFATISATNEVGDYLKNNEERMTLVVQPLPEPMPGLLLMRANDEGVVESVLNGSATKILIGQSTNYGFSVKNRGSKALKAGSVIRFEQFVSDTAVFSGDAFASAGSYSADLDSQPIDVSPGGKWTCVTGTGTMPVVEMPASLEKAQATLNESPSDSIPTTTVAAPEQKTGPAIRCEMKLVSSMALNEVTPLVNLTVRLSNSAKVGMPEWPAFATFTTVKAAPVARFGMNISITEFAADLVPSFIAPSGPRPGGAAVATLSVKNNGDADASAQFVVVPGMTNGRITSVKGDSWKCARLGSALAAGFTVCSRMASLKAGSDSPALSIAYESTNKKGTALYLQAASLVSTSRNIAAGRGSNLSVALRPALAFAVVGPKSIVDQFIDASGNRVPSTILFSTEGNADGAVFTWRQLCTTQEDVQTSNGECTAIAPVAKWLEGTPSSGSTAILMTPKVSTGTTLLFEVTANEGRASSTSRASVVVLPLPTADGPTGQSASGSGSSVLHRVPVQTGFSVRALGDTVPTTGAGDTSYTTTADTGVAINGNLFGGSSVTVAQGGAVSLTAAATGVGAVTYTWSQSSGPNPSVISGVATNSATLAFTAPSVNVTVTLRVEATDSRGSKASDVITVIIGTGGTAAVAASITEGDGPIVVDTSNAFTLNASASGTGSISYSWTQVSGSALTLSNSATASVTIAATGVSGSAALLVTATDAAGAKATDQVELQLAPSSAPAPLCDFVSAASSKSLTTLQTTIDALGISGLDLTKFVSSSEACTSASTVSFTDAGFSLGSYLTVSGASGSVSAAGFAIRSARFTGPSDWGSPQFAIATTDAVGLFVPFSSTSTSIGAFEGEIVASSMPFLNLPSGYTTSAVLRFSVDATGVKTVALDADANGTAANGKTPTARVSGTVATNGTFALEASLTDVIDLFGTSVNFAGTVTKSDATKTAAVSLSGSLEGPVTLTSGVVLNGLAAKRDETGVVTGSGTLTVGADASALVLTANLSYTDANNHSLTVTATSPNGSWTPAKDFVIPLASASGSYTMTNGERNIAITVVGSNFAPMSGLAITSPTLGITATCAVNATCAIKVDVSADAQITLGSTSTTGKLTGTFDTTTQSGSFTASIGAIPIVAGLSMSGASLTVASTNMGSTNQATTITLTGSAVVFEKTVTVTAVFSSSGILLTADLPEIALFGTSGPVFKPGQLSWSSGPLTGFTPKVPSLPKIKAVNLLAKTPHLSAAITLPSQLTDIASTVVSGAGDITIDGDINFETGQFSFAASLTSTSVDISGSVSRASSSAALTYSLSASVKTPITVVSGVTLKTLSMSIGNATGSTAVSGSGEITITTTTSSAITVGFNLSYVSSTDYSFNLAVSATGTTSWAPFSGFTVPLGNITGSVVRSGNTTKFSANFSSTADYIPFPGVKISTPGVGVAATCTTGSTCLLAFTASGKVSIDVGGGWQGPVTLSGSFGKDTSSLTATFPNITVTTGVVITAPSFTLAYTTLGAKPGITASISGGANILGTTLQMSASFSKTSVLVVATLSNWTPVSGVTLSSASFVFSTTALTNVILDNAPALGPITAEANKPVLVGSFAVPSWLSELLKQPSLTKTNVSIPLSDLAGGKLPTLKIMLPTPAGWYMYKVGGSSMRFTAIGFEVSGSPTPAMSVIGQTEMLTGASDEIPVPLEMRGTVSGATLSLSLSLGKNADGSAFAWTNALGVKDLTLTQAAIQVGITLTAPIPLPSLGIAATAILPSSWRSPLNMDAKVAVRLVANIDVSKPCFSLEAGTLGADNTTISAGSAKVASIAGGALTSTYMKLVIAPTGCTVGNVVVLPGVSAAFTGSVFGASVAVDARIGTNPFSLEANVAIGAFNIGTVKVNETKLGIKVSSDENYVSFSGGVTIGATTVGVSGKAGINTTDGPYIDFTGSINKLVIVQTALEISNAEVTINLKPAKQYFKIVATGNFDILGSTSSVSLDMQMANYQLQSLNASVKTKRSIGGIVALDGTFNIAYKQGSLPTLDFTAEASVGGFTLGTTSGRISDYDATITGSVSIPEVFSAQVSGSFTWKTNSSASSTNSSPAKKGFGFTAQAKYVPQAGDFSVSAKNIPISLGGFPGSGDISVSRSGGAVSGSFSATWAMGAGDVGGNVSVSGSFDSTGNFSFKGSGSLTLVAFSADVTVSGSKKGSTWSFAMSSTMKVMGLVDVGFSGSFYSTGGVTRFTMTGSANLSAAGIGGVGGVTGAFTISNEPNQSGLSVAFSVKVMTTTVSGSMWVAADGTYSASLAMTISLGGVSVSGQLKISRGLTATWACTKTSSMTVGTTKVSYCSGFGTAYVEPKVNTFVLSASLTYSKVSYSASLPIAVDGSFSYIISSGDQSWSKDVNFGISGGCCGASYSYDIEQNEIDVTFYAGLQVSSSSPYLALSGGGSTSIEYRYRDCSWKGCGGWSSWKSLGSCGVDYSTSGKFSINCYGFKYSVS